MVVVAQGLEHLQTVHARQAQIQNRQVEGFAAQGMQRAGPVLQPVERIALGFECGHYALAEGFVVFNQ